MPRPFPAETVRDLIGIARMLYRTWATHGVPNDPRLPELVAVGKDLQHSVVMARGARGPKQLRAAWELAERATHRLGHVLDAYVAVKPLVAAALPLVDQSASDDKVDRRRRRG